MYHSSDGKHSYVKKHVDQQIVSRRRNIAETNIKLINEVFKSSVGLSKTELVPGDPSPKFSLKTINGSLTYPDPRFKDLSIIFVVYDSHSGYSVVMWNNNQSLEDFITTAPPDGHFIFISTSKEKGEFNDQGDAIWIVIRRLLWAGQSGQSGQSGHPQGVIGVFRRKVAPLQETMLVRPLVRWCVRRLVPISLRKLITSQLLREEEKEEEIS
jgi:hypothetical protein